VKPYKILKFLKLLFGLYRKVDWNDNTRIEPVSRIFGIDRGQPVDRYYIEKYLNHHREMIRGQILEVGEERYSRQFADQPGSCLFETIHFGEREKPRVSGGDTISKSTGVKDQAGSTSFTGDLTDTATLPAGRYDCFICTQTYNFIFDVQKAIAGACHLLKEGGVVLATVAGISQVSRYDMDRWGDYWRFTGRSALQLFETEFGKGQVEVVTYGNVLAAKAFLDGLATGDLPDLALLDEPDPDYPVIIGIRAIKRSNGNKLIM
jgi:hypothetical protein